MDIAKADKTCKRRATAIRASGFYLRMQIASCVLGSPKCFGRPKTTCSGCEPEMASSKVGSPDESQITN
jgi:hypothetical protein